MLDERRDQWNVNTLDDSGQVLLKLAWSGFREDFFLNSLRQTDGQTIDTE